MTTQQLDDLKAQSEFKNAARDARRWSVHRAWSDGLTAPEIAERLRLRAEVVRQDLRALELTPHVRDTVYTSYYRGAKR